MNSRATVVRAAFALLILLFVAVFCGLELLFAWNASLAGQSESLAAFPYLVFSQEVALPYPPEIVIQRNLSWIALALFCAPAILFRVSVRPALLSSALVLLASVALDTLLASRLDHFALAEGFAFDMAARGLAALGCLIALITYDGDRWGIAQERGAGTISNGEKVRLGLLLTMAVAYVVNLLTAESGWLSVLSPMMSHADFDFVSNILRWRALVVLGAAMLAVVCWSRGWRVQELMIGLGLVSLANLGFDVPLYFSALAEWSPGLFATVLTARLLTAGLIFEFALFYGRAHPKEIPSYG